MMSIQAVGLNVTVREAKKIPKGMEGAAGMEGKVVEQTPTAGGMAMYGTTVTLSVWKPGQAAAGAGGVPTGATSWGAGSPSSYPGAGQTSYPGTTGTMQPAYPQGTTMGGGQMQGSQGFQVQQYYYPNGSGAGAPAQQGQQPAGQQPAQQPMDPYGGQQGEVPQGGQPQTVPPRP